jgi:hypothetical protein
VDINVLAEKQFSSDCLEKQEESIYGLFFEATAEAFEEHAAICEFDGDLSRDEAEAIAWREDDRR